MPVKEGKAVLRVSLDEKLIEQLKIAAVKVKLNPHTIVEAALRSFLSEDDNLSTLKHSKESE